MIVSQRDAVLHQAGDLVLGVRAEHDEGILDAPVGGVGDVRDAREAVEADVVAPGVPRQRAQHFGAQGGGGGEAGGEAFDGDVRRRQQLRDGLVALAALLDLGEAVAQGADQCFAAAGIVEQVVFQIRIALHHPDVAQHLIEHARRTAGDALGAQPVEHAPGLQPEQADDDLAVGERGVVVGDFAQADGHGEILAYCGAA
jgi:hypothetical protein